MQKQQQQHIFKRNKLAIAVGLVMLGGVLTGCDNSNDPVGSGAVGTFTIVANGGVGGDKGDGELGLADGQGGNGGTVIATGTFNKLAEFSLPVEVVVHTNGVANTAFTTPVRAPSAAVLGDNPLTVSSDVTIDAVFTRLEDGDLTAVLDQTYVGIDNVVRTHTGLAGTPVVYATDALFTTVTAYLVTNELGIYLNSGTATADLRYSGLSVASGATLTLGENFPGIGAQISFREDISNSGTITRATANVAHGLTLVGRYYLASGNIANAGVEGAAHEHGGDTFIFAANGISNSGGINTSGFDDTVDDGGQGGSITLDSDGYVLSSGPLDTSGGDGEGFGGFAGHVQMVAAYTESTGDIDMRGGNNITTTATAGNGGNGGNLTLSAEFDTVHSAAVDGSGGNGDAGGAGGHLNMNNDLVGDVKNAGKITLNGGLGTGDIAGNGGAGGNVDMSSNGGHLLNSGDLTSVGGDASKVDQAGGAGGDLSFMAFDGAGDSMAGSVEVSGFLNVNGGNATVAASIGRGGNGGNIGLDRKGFIDPDEFFGEKDDVPRVALLGYVSIDANGGDGANGGSGQQAALEIDNHKGSATNWVPVNARGGNSTATGAGSAGSGGNAGSVSVAADGGFISPDPDAVPDPEHEAKFQASNKAAIVVTGGTGVGVDADPNFSSGGNGGGLAMFSHLGSDNSGVITADGGAGGKVGGSGGTSSFDSDISDSKNTAQITANGAVGAVNGGNGGAVDFFNGSGDTRNTAQITANGAVGTADRGGRGGGASFFSASGDTNNAGVIDANGADGALRGGSGGFLDMFGAASVNTANITLNAANATETDLVANDTFGGNGGHVDIMGLAITGVATNSGTISHSKGTGEFDGEEGSTTVGIVCEGTCTP